VRESLQQMSEQEALRRLPNTHSIIELVAHMTAWRTYAIRKLAGDADYRVRKDQNFPSVSDWPAAREALEESHRQLMRILEELSDDDLWRLVPGVEHPLTFYTLLHGIIHHDLYHTGQIALIKKATSQQTF